MKRRKFLYSLIGGISLSSINCSSINTIPKTFPEFFLFVTGFEMNSFQKEKSDNYFKNFDHKLDTSFLTNGPKLYRISTLALVIALFENIIYNKEVYICDLLVRNKEITKNMILDFESKLGIKSTIKYTYNKKVDSHLRYIKIILTEARSLHQFDLENVLFLKQNC